MSGGNFTGRTGLGDGQFAHGGHRGDHDRHHGHGFGIAAGLAAGSALGYGYGGSYDPYTYFGYYDPGYSTDYSSDNYAYDDSGDGVYDGSVVSSDADPSYCALHYKSYDPTSGTYLGRDGRRHPCP